MKGNDLQKLSVAELVGEFTAVELHQFQMELESDIPAQNRCVRRAMAIAEELKMRPGDQRSALLALYDHPNIQVRLMAARLTLAVAPIAARELVQTVADSKQYPYAMHAGMCLWALEQGIFKPT